MDVGDRTKSVYYVDEIESTREISIPHDPLDRVIGQEEAVALAKIAAKQGRHLLIVGPPGTGKSMIGKALAIHLPVPTTEIRIVHNPEKPERPVVEIVSKQKALEQRKKREEVEGELIKPEEAPLNVAEKLGYRCMNCGAYSNPQEKLCPRCGNAKNTTLKAQVNPQSGMIFGDVISDMLGALDRQINREKGRVTTTRKRFDKEEVVVFEESGTMIKILDQTALENRRELDRATPRKTLVSIDRIPFILATGASETELLGDVKHDPYGGHSQLGSQPYERVVPGTIHEAHEGVLFIDELPHLGHLQRFILTAMQDKRFPIIGRNPQSSGASVRVDNVPCDFIFVGACNIQDLSHILSPLRSRIIGSGYEILIETVMPINDNNTSRMLQFIAQEITMDGKIPHMDGAGIKVVIDEAKRRALNIDNKKKSYTMRLRDLGGLIRAAGDCAVLEESEVITKKHVKIALKKSKNIESQIRDRYGSYYSAISSDISDSQRQSSPYYSWNQTAQDQDQDHGYH